ncbi:MAG: glycosyltransferase family 39 protein [Terracidiphilus sp.]
MSRSIPVPSIAVQKTDAGGRGSARAAMVYAPALVAGLAIRLWMLKDLFEANGDTLLYGDLAKNLLLHGRYAYAFGVGGPLQATLIRLPGYPLFLALCFRLFGVGNYLAAAYVQIAFELLGCLLLADFARRVAPVGIKSGAALATLWLAALCPFTASYTVLPLTETPTLFALALAMWAMARFYEKPNWPNALCFTFAVSYAALLRPDGALAAVAFAPAMVAGLARSGLPPGSMQRRRLARMAAVCVFLALVPFAAWAWRNWRVFHVFEPLAPRYANDPGERTYPGWERWYRTWSLDFVSTYQIYWIVPGGPFDVTALPSRAFDSAAQRAKTEALADDYEAGGEEISPALDARFGALARARIRAHPLRYYVWLPLGRLADMILRPRVENLNIDLDWWVYAHHHDETRLSWALAALNLFYLLLGIAGLCLRPRFWQALLAYLVLRCALLLTVGAPEARYTLEFFPILFACGGIAAAAAAQRILRKRRGSKSAGSESTGSAVRGEAPGAAAIDC